MITLKEAREATGEPIQRLNILMRGRNLGKTVELAEGEIANESGVTLYWLARFNADPVEEIEPILFDSIAIGLLGIKTQAEFDRLIK